VYKAREVWKPLRQRQIGYRSIGSLNAPQRMASGELVEVGDLVVGATGIGAAAVDGLTDDRRPVFQMLAELTEDAQPVAWWVASGLKWGDAARAVGLPKDDGRKIRRKAQRLTTKYAERLAQRAQIVGDGLVVR
jgi:hypothetical protein